MDEPVKYLALTKGEAEIILDTYKVSAVASRYLVLKAASILLEFEAEEAARAALLAAHLPAIAPKE